MRRHTHPPTSATVLLKTNDNLNWGYIRFELWFPIKYAKANMNSMDYDQPLKGQISLKVELWFFYNALTSGSDD